jgi:hypothetical protein
LVIAKQSNEVFSWGHNQFTWGLQMIGVF